MISRYARDPNVLEFPELPGEDLDPPDPEDLEAAAGDLLDTDDFLAEVDRHLEGRYGGPTDAVKLVALALYSRHLKAPVSVVVRGESSAGKSYAITQALEFAAPEAHHALTASSPRALVYSKEDLRHRHLVIFEGKGLVNDLASYLVRSLLSEGRIEYEVTDFESKDTLKISKEGPTGLILSTAGKLDYELGTRMISVSIDDSPAVTAEILRAEAQEAEGLIDEVDLTPFHAFDRVLQLCPREVIVPFASLLADLTDPRAVRMRRDFGAVLGLIKTHALIHHRHRDDGPGGQVVASVADYQAIHGLISRLLADAAGRAVPEPVRQVVEALDRLEAQGTGPLTVRCIADELERDRSTASRHLNRALAMGFIAVTSEPRDRARTFGLGEPLPEDATVLPDPAKLKRS